VLSKHSEVSLTQCAIEAGAGDGLVFSGEGMAKVVDSTVAGNAGRGLAAERGAKVDLTSCRLDRNGLSGLVVVFGGAQATVSRSFCQGNGMSGLEVSRGGTSKAVESPLAEITGRES